MKKLSLPKLFGLFCIAIVLFYALGLFSVFLARVSSNVATFWPANAALISLGLFIRPKYSALLVLGAFGANVALQITFGDPLVLAAGFASANALEIALVLALFYRLNLHQDRTLLAPRVLQIFAVVAFAAVPASAVGSAVVMVFFGAPMVDTMLRWWAGDIVSSFLVLLPVFAYRATTVVTRGSSRLFRTGFIEALVLSLVTFSAYFLFAALDLDSILLIVLPGIWLALKGRLFEVALTNSLLLLIIAGAVIAGVLPFDRHSESIEDAVFHLQMLGMFSTFPSFLIATAIDRLWQSQAKAKQRNSQLSLTLKHMNQGISAFDGNYGLAVWNENYAKLFGMDFKDLYQGMPFLELLERQKQNGDFLGQPADLLQSILDAVENGDEYRADTVLSSGVIIHTIHAKAVGGGWVATHEDVTQKRQFEMRLEHESLHDVMTGLPNRRYFEQHLDTLLPTAIEENLPVALMAIDLDKFKVINDTLGHKAGDAVLVHATQAILKIIGEQAFFARVGGDEFLVVLQGISLQLEIARIAMEINRSLAEPFYFEGKECDFNASIGVSLQTGNLIDRRQMLVEADLGLYAAKKAGRGCCRFYDKRMRQAAAEEQIKAIEIRLGLEKGEIECHFQPVYDVVENKLVGVEILPRWQHPTHGALEHSKFQAAAEQAHLTTAIDRLILEHVAAAVRDCDRTHVMVPKISVPVAAQTLMEFDIRALISELGFSADHLILQFDERDVLDHQHPLVVESLQKLVETGISIEVGRFGSGDTSLAALSRLNPFSVRLDPTLVRLSGNDRFNAGFVRNMLSIAAALNIKVVFCDVIDTNQLRALRDQGAKFMQGECFAAAMPMSEFESFVYRESKIAV